MTLFQSILLGIIQGATEFLPISSSGHLVLIPSLLTILNDLRLLVHRFRYRRWPKKRADVEPARDRHMDPLKMPAESNLGKTKIRTTEAIAAVGSRE
jgi:hypothetical protein